MQSSTVFKTFKFFVLISLLSLIFTPSVLAFVPEDDTDTFYDTITDEEIEAELVAYDLEYPLEEVEETKTYYWEPPYDMTSDEFIEKFEASVEAAADAAGCNEIVFIGEYVVYEEGGEDE